MGQRSERARRALLDSAEELYARHGIDAVSNRKITEHAGASNHSAVTYHFGGRDELIKALLRRQLAEMESRRAELVAGLAADAGLWDLVACRILPLVEQLAALPVPSWRARFLHQVHGVSAVAPLMNSAFDDSETLAEVRRRVLPHVEGVPEKVLQARSGILGHMVLGLCAEYEAQVEAGTQEGDWISVGYFLIDAVTGMLVAPVTRRGGRVAPASSHNLI